MNKIQNKREKEHRFLQHTTSEKKRNNKARMKLHITMKRNGLSLYMISKHTGLAHRTVDNFCNGQDLAYKSLLKIEEYINS